MAVRQPIEEGDGFVKFVRRHVGRILLQQFAGLLHPRDHRFPVAHGGTHMRKRGRERLLQPCALVVIQGIERQHDHAFLETGALGVAGAALVARARDDRVERGANARAHGAHRARAGIVEERNVVIDRENDGFGAAEGRVFRRRREGFDERSTGCALGRTAEHRLHQRGQFGAGVADHVFGRRITREAGEEPGQGRIVRPNQARAGREMVRRFGGFVVGFIRGFAMLGLGCAYRSHTGSPGISVAGGC